MNITVQINGIDTEIELTEEQVASIEAQKKPKKFEMKYESNCYVLGTANTTPIRTFEYNSLFLVSSSKDGSLRKTKESAELSLARNKRANRLEALVDQLDGLKEFVEGEKNWYVQNCGGTWYTQYTTSIYYQEVVYMTKECAVEVCRILNAGEYEL